jgi:hypothetical protein
LGIVVFNFLLVVVGSLQVIMLLKTLRAIKEQSEIANRTLIATFRPKFIVRSVVVTRAPLWGVIGQPNSPWLVEYMITKAEAKRKLPISFHD